MSGVIHSRKFVQQWAEALHIDPNECYRIVIDANVNDAVRIYVSKFGTQDLLDVEPPDISEAKIVVLEPGE